MIKKITIIFTFVLLIISISKVEALSKDEVINSQKIELDKLIEIKIEGTWKDMQLDKYTSNGLTIYKIGNNSDNGNNITIQEEKNDTRIMKIIKNGYGKNKSLAFQLDSDNDLYAATKIAIDCISNTYSIEDVDNYYRPKINLSEELNIKAQKIIDVAKELLAIGYNEEVIYQSSISLYGIDEFEKDNINENYYSQKYIIETENAELINYEIASKNDIGINYFIANIETGEEQEYFDNNQNLFKIMVPEENKEESFQVEISVRMTYYTNKIFNATDGKNKYIVYSKEEDNSELVAMLNNKTSNLTINLIDAETQKNIYGGIVEVDGIEYTINDDNTAIIWNLGKGNVKVNLIKAPEDYLIKDNEYNIVIGYKESHIENIELFHKKGNVLINTNLKDAIYEIYNFNSEKIGTYTTDEEGNISVQQINTGTYKLVQTSVPDGYKKIDDIIFDVFYNKTTSIDITNEKEAENTDNDKEEDKNGKEDNDDNENDITNKKEDTNLIDKNDESIKENIKNDEKIDEIKNEANKQPSSLKNIINDQQKSKNNNLGNIEVLPRTGKDYLEIKLFLLNLFIFLIHIIITIKNRYSNISKVKE